MGQSDALRALQTLEDIGIQWILWIRNFQNVQHSGSIRSESTSVQWFIGSIRGDPLGTVALEINDLDMTVASIPAGSSVSPWVWIQVQMQVRFLPMQSEGADHLNNVEQVTIDAPAAGNYTVCIFQVQPFLPDISVITSCGNSRTDAITPHISKWRRRICSG